MSKALTRAQLHLINAVQGRIEDRKERGATMVEYGLLVAFIAIVALVGVTALGTNLLALFNGITF